MKKISKIIILGIAAVLLLAGCSTEKDEKEIKSATRSETTVSETGKAVDEGSADKKSESTSGIDLAEINKEIMDAIGVKDGLVLSETSAKALYGIEASDMKQCVGFSVMSGTFPHEVIMIEAANEEAAQKIEAAFQSKIDAFRQQSKNYDAANYALAQKCEVQKNGDFYAMFLSPDFEDIKGVYTKYIN